MVLSISISAKNTVSLRIVNASVLPILPATHPQAVLYAVAERAAKLIAVKKY